MTEKISFRKWLVKKVLDMARYRINPLTKGYVELLGGMVACMVSTAISVSEMFVNLPFGLALSLIPIASFFVFIHGVYLISTSDCDC